MNKIFLSTIICIIFLTGSLSAGLFDYTGTSWSTTGANADPWGIASNGTHVFISDKTDKEIYVYDIDGTYITSWDTSADGVTQGTGVGIDQSGDFIYLSDRDSDYIYKYQPDGTFVLKWNVNDGEGFVTGAGVTSNGTHVFGYDYSATDVFVWSNTGVYQGSWDVLLTGGTRALTTDGEFIWLASHSNDLFYEYYINGTYRSITYPMDHGDTSTAGLGMDDVNFYVQDGTTIYLYESIVEIEENITITLISPSNDSSLSEIETNFIVNQTSNIFDFKNTTYQVWFANGTLFNSSTISISGSWNLTNISIDSFILENYLWNSFSCVGDGNGTNCSYASNNFSFIVGSTINTETFDPFVFETELTSFEINLNLVSGAVLYDQDLIYNGTTYQGTKTDLESDQYSLSLDLGIPVLNGALSENRTFFWSITFQRSDGSFFFQNLTMNQQNVSRISMTTCSSGNMALNFTAWDEENVETKLQPFDFFGTFFYWLGDGSVYKNISVTNLSINSTKFCISDPTKTFYSNAQIQYEKTGFVKRSYFLINASLTNNTNHIKLVLLNSSASTSFIIDVTDENQLPVPNVYINIQRFYPGLGIYQTVEMGKTDSGGSTVGHFEAETEDYIVTISENNTVLFQSEAQKIFCRNTPCTLTFQIGSVLTTQWLPFGDVNGLVWSLNFSESTKLWTYTFIDTTGAAQSGRLHVYKDKPTSRLTICNSTVSSSAGTITCNVSGQTGTIYAAAYITQSPEILLYLKSAIIESLNDIFGLEGLFLSSFILLVLAMAGLWNPVVGIFLVSVGMIMMSFIGLASFGSVALWSIIFIGLIIAWGMKT